MKVDSTGKKEWDKRYDAGTNDVFKIIRTTNDGNLIAAGGTVLPGTHHPDAWLVKLNPHGDTLWTRHYSYYGGDSHTYVEDMIQTSDGGYALTGYTIANVPTGNDLWVLKTDSLGRTCDSPPCQGVITGINEPALFQPNTLSIYPNPTLGTTVINFPKLTPVEGIVTIFDARGQIKGQFSLPKGTSQYALSLNQPPGLYVLKLETTDGRIYTCKLVVAE